MGEDIGFEGKPVTITSALPYVNGVKHLGNIVGSLLPADIFHRFLDLMDVDNIFICGTDEHGAQTEIAAMQEHMKPDEYADKYHEIQKEIYKKWNFDFTFFGRTSSKTHTETTQQAFKSIYKNGYILKSTITLPYCENCERFLADRYIEGTCPKCSKDARGDQCEYCGRLMDPNELINPRCKICAKNDIIFKKEKHLFLDLSKLQDELKKWILKNKHWPVGTRNFALGWIDEGLKPRCITRNLKWGVKVPLNGYSQLVFYVWFDAPLGYISMTKDAKLKNWKKYWTNSLVFHFLGKDNIPFHTVFWPGMLMAGKDKNNYTLPYFVQGYEYLNWEGQKFSTSRNIGVFSDKALDLFPSDYWRYYLASMMPEKKDANFEWTDFQNRINNELIANYGNLFYRTTSFISKHFGKVPRPLKPGTAEKELQERIAKSLEKIKEFVHEVKLKDALKECLAISDEVNKYLQIKEPWIMVRDKKTRKYAASTLYYAVNSLAVATFLIRPFIPQTTEQVIKCLDIKKSEKIRWKDLAKPLIKPGTVVRPLILFQKVDDNEISRIKEKMQSIGNGQPKNM
ncbi:MAG: methionine--tRNA ligase [Candidatus Aenigmarchaeota archaeon]|nr:methionine--tRNA ligase [Candidatus Aenigmarchaeota archaeon]